MFDGILQRSKMTWRQITNAHRHGLGTEEISSRGIRKSIPQEFIKETKFLAMRAIGKAPMVGVRRQRIFYVLWVDTDFSLYRH